MTEVGFGGSCHWCTEAIFASLIGVSSVQQGWIASDGEHSSFSEAVIVTFNEAVISLETLIAVHLYTHSCTSTHSMRSKYRSAIYVYDAVQSVTASQAIRLLQSEFEEPIITEVLHLKEFKLNQEEYLNYYYRNPDKLFCQNIVNPKLRLLIKDFSNYIDKNKLDHLINSNL